jgi:hypothetical protein
MHQSFTKNTTLLNSHTGVVHWADDDILGGDFSMVITIGFSGGIIRNLPLYSLLQQHKASA